MLIMEKIMKKFLAVILLALCFSLTASSKGKITIQMMGSKATSAPVFNADDFVFFGVDYSKVRLIGDHGHGSGTNISVDYIRDTYFNQINELILNETKKYDFSKAIGGKTLKYDFSSVFKINKAASTENMKAPTEVERHDMKIISQMVKEYATTQTAKSGYGMVLIADQMNKYQSTAYFFVVFFDISSKTPIFSAYVKGKAGGFGYRNFWAGAVADVAKQMKKSDWEYWEKSIKE